MRIDKLGEGHHAFDLIEAWLMGGPEAWLSEWEARDRTTVTAAVLTHVSADLLQYVARERGQEPRDVL